MSPQEWLKVLKVAYLQGFIRRGGSSVKFGVVENLQDLHMVVQGLMDLSKAEGYLTVQVEARRTKVQLIDLLFHELARQIDWDGLACDLVKKLFKDNGRRIPEQAEECQWACLASLNGCDEMTMQRDVNSWLEAMLYKNFQMSREFRLAMIQLCLAQLDAPYGKSPVAGAIKSWLRGDIKQMAPLKKMLIFQKVSRNNARDLIASLAYFIRLVGKPGLVMSVDISAFLSTSGKGKESNGMTYTASAVMDGYEMLRQFIDGCDEIQSLLLVVLTPSESI